MSLFTARPLARAPVPGRACGRCTLCCKTMAVAELDKPPGEWCSHCERSKGCAIYASRPEGCREFYCEWMLSPKLGREWKPDRARFALMLTPTGHLAVCVDPDFPAAWKRAPYYQTLRRWACQRAADPTSAWPGVDVWIGRRCIIVLPDGEKDLGIVAADEEVRIDRTMTDAGPVYVATKFSAGAGPPQPTGAASDREAPPASLGWLRRLAAGRDR
jgi:hypothetical protein